MGGGSGGGEHVGVGCVRLPLALRLGVRMGGLARGHDQQVIGNVRLTLLCSQDC